jgi:hypothetical protein
MRLRSFPFAMTFLTLSTFADTVSWLNPGSSIVDTNWTTDANWDTSAQPLQGSVAYIYENKTCNINNLTPVAQTVVLAGTNTFLSGNGLPSENYKLTLYPQNGDGITLQGSNSSILYSVITFANSGSITIYPLSQTDIDTTTTIRGSQTLITIGGSVSGLLTNNGTIAPTDNISWLNSFSMIGGNTQNNKSIACLSSIQSGSISFLSGTLVNINSVAVSTGGIIPYVLVDGDAEVLNASSYFIQGNSGDIGLVEIKGGNITNQNNGELITAVNRASASGYISQVIIADDPEITNSGGGNALYADASSSINDIVISGGSIYNDAYFIHSQNLIGTVTITGSASLINNYLMVVSRSGTPLAQIGTVSISGGSITNNYHFAVCESNFGVINLLDISGGTIYSVPQSVFSMVPIHMSGGYITMDGLMSCRDGSLFEGGTLEGTGSLLTSGTCYIESPIKLGTITAGLEVGFPYVEGDAFISPSFSTLYVNSIADADVDITNDSILYGTGAVTGTVHLYEPSSFSPGNGTPSIGDFSIGGNFIMDNNTVLNLDFSSSDHDIVYLSGDLILNDGAILSLNTPPGFVPKPGYLLISQQAAGLNLLRSGIISGSFTEVRGDPNLLALGIHYGAAGVWLGDIAGGDLLPYAKTPNQRAVASNLDALNGQTNPCLQEEIDAMFDLSEPDLDSLLNQLEPSELKGHQIALEEINFVINDELNDLLYSHYQGFKGFIFGGFERLSQNGYGQYAGYRTQGGFEMIGFTYGKDKCQAIASVGSIQARTEFKKANAHATSTSVLGNLGISGSESRWMFGVDGLFSYNYLTTKRRIYIPNTIFDSKATSSHQGYNLKANGLISYSKTFTNLLLRPYESFSYMLTHENRFKEHGADCLDLTISSENRNTLRNDLGIHSETCLSESIKPFVDLGWIYEYRFGGQKYKTAFVDTSPTMSISGLTPTKNYVKVALGLSGSKNKWHYNFKLNGQYGKRFSESGVNLSIDRKF